MTPTARAIGYIRFSSDSQADGSSIERQTDNIKAYCQRSGLTLVDTLIDDGLSGFKGKHISKGKLGVFLNEVDKGKHQGTALVVEQMDRLSRQGIMQTGDLLERLLKGGVEVHVNGRVIRDLEGLETGIMNLVESWTAREYSKKLQERVIKGKRDRRAKFLKGEVSVLTELLPLWLEKRDGKVCPVKSAHGKGKGRKIPATVVVEVFELAAQGNGAPKILRQLNGHGAGLSQVWINKTLSNRAVLGEFVTGGETLHDYYPRIIDESLWQAARRAIDSRNRMTGEQRKRCVLGRSSDGNLFPGLLFDVTTPNRPYSLWYQKRGAEGTFLVTNTAQAGKGEVHRIRYEIFESAFLRFVTELDWQSILSHGEPQELTVKLAKQTELTNETATLTRLIGVRRMALDAAEDIETVNQTAASLKRLEDKQAIAETELQAITAEIDAVRSKLATLENPQALLDLLANPGESNVRAKLRMELAKRISRISLDWTKATKLSGPAVWMTVDFVNSRRHFASIEADGSVNVEFNAP